MVTGLNFRRDWRIQVTESPMHESRWISAPIPAGPFPCCTWLHLCYGTIWQAHRGNSICFVCKPRRWDFGDGLFGSWSFHVQQFNMNVAMLDDVGMEMDNVVIERCGAIWKSMQSVSFNSGRWLKRLVTCISGNGGYIWLEADRKPDRQCPESVGCF